MSLVFHSPAGPRRIAFLIGGGLVAATAGAWAATGTEGGTVFGTTVQVGSGYARSYLTTDDDGRVVELGIALSEEAVADPSTDGGHGHGRAIVQPDGHTTEEHVLDLPPGLELPFQHAVVNWNPAGHEPPGVYDVPHFDFHFYTIAPEERLAMTPEADADYKARSERLPPPELVPGGYIMPQLMPFPQMGLHWVDPASPELNGVAFTHTFIMGSWDGRVHFWEPMITRSFLESKQTAEASLPRPLRAARAGVYPGAWSVRWDEGAREWRIALLDFAPLEGL